MNTRKAIVGTTLLAALAAGLAAVVGVDGPVGAVLLTDSSAAVLAAALIIQSDPDRAPRASVGIALSAALIAAVLMIWHTGTGRPGPIAALSVGVATLTMFVDALARILAMRARGLAHWLPVTILILAASTPFWAAATNSAVGADALVGISPLGYLAAMADYDFLRSTIGYRHSTISGLRYDYPNAGIYTLCLAVAAFALTTVTRLRTTCRSPDGEPEKCQ